MSTSTILRVKRRLADNPQDAFVLTCKRRKTDAEELSPSLFVFRGTVDKQDNFSIKKLVPQQDPKDQDKNINNIVKKLRNERKAVSNELRYELVSQNRGLNDSNIRENLEENSYHMVDLVQKDKDSQDVEYAYDLYTCMRQDFDVSLLDNLVSIENYETELIYGSHRDNGRLTPSTDNESIDSNDENHFRNDYPDEESDDDEEMMTNAMKRCVLEDDELSSDYGEDNIYDDTYAINPDDVRLFGTAYAKYKASNFTHTLQQNPGNSFVHSTEDKDSDISGHGYKSDSDDGFYYGQDEDTNHHREQYRGNSSDSDAD